MIEVCGLATLPDLPARPGRWFADWVIRSPRDASIHIATSFATLCSVRPEDAFTVNEPFGGMGAQAALVEALFSPGLHTVSEVDPEAVEYLKLAVPEVRVGLRDAYSDPLLVAGLQLLDFGDLTLHRMRTDPARRGLLEQAFGSEVTRAVVLTDIAGPRLHLHQRTYAGEDCGTYPAYLRTMGRYIQETYGFAPRVTNYTRWSSVTLFEADHTGPHRVDPTPDGVKGLLWTS